MQKIIKKHIVNRWTVIVLSIICCSLSISLSADAQTFTQRLQKNVSGEGSVTVHHNKNIDELVNGPYVTPEKPVEVKKPVKKEEAKPVHVTLTKPQPHQQDSASTPLPEKGVKVMGFRIQAFAGGNSRKDRRRAEQVGNELRMLFPTEAIYVHFYSPRWICRMGNYRTYGDALQTLQQVKKLGYTAATIVKGKITVNN